MQSKLLLNRLADIAREQVWSAQKFKSMVGIFKSKSLDGQIQMIRKLEGRV